jgi:integrase
MKRTTFKYKGKTITRLPNGRHQVRIKDTASKAYRPSFASLKEAKVAIDQSLQREARGERFLASSAHTTFSEALDLRRKQLMDDGRSRAALHSFQTIRNSHLEEEFGRRKLSEFVDQRMTFVKAWFDKKKDEGYAASTMDRWRVEIKQTFDRAIEEGKMAPPNPIMAFGVSIPHVDKDRREPLPIEDMISWMRGASERKKGQHSLATAIRRVMSIVGFSAPFRTQDLCGLCWDCVLLEQRLFFFRRVVKQVHGDKRWRLEDTTKTGEEGFGECHMSPAAHAALCWWREVAQQLGLPTEGRNPVFRTPTATLLEPVAVQGTYVRVICENGGLVGADSSLKHTWYSLRHTVPSMWRAIGMDLDEIKDRMRHMDLNTTEIYRHRVPEYCEVLRPQVEDVMDDLDLQRTPEGLIDALAIVLARMWRAAGVDVLCSPPTTMRRKRKQPLAIEGPVSDGPLIEMTPTSVTTNGPAPVAQLLMSSQQLRDARIAEARRLYAPPHNLTKVGYP